ncbi:MAG: glycerol-3-phosphate 1-O-acyltransferase PlsB [Gammaproteobacteria bacterium]
MQSGFKESLEQWFGLKAPFLWLVQRILMLWVKATILPADFDELGIDSDRPICYVLDLDGVSNSLILRDVCHELELPDSGGVIQGTERELPATIYLRRLSGVLVRRADPRISPQTKKIAQAYADGDLEDVQFVPVAIHWGRKPEKEESLVKLLFSDSWSIAGRLRKIMIILIHGRNMFVQFSRPVSLRDQFPQGDFDDRSVRKLSRILRVHFRRVREAAIGPDLSHRRLLVSEIMDSDSVRRAISKEAARSDISIDKAREKARSYITEIAANYSHSSISVMETLLKWVWNSLYSGIVQNNFQSVREVAHGREVIYVPCHRSHIDYLLLSYMLYVQGLVPPHVAAGINLNLPVVGGILRRGGAFFLRRSFRGQRLYAAVFDAYLRRNLSKGVSLEYFIEGTRSRTGKLLDAKGGMLSMTVKSYLKDRARPVVFVPVYFGYERLLEGRSYENELGGVAKKKESIWGLLKSVKLLRENFGQVYVNFGTPIHLDEMLDQEAEGWQDRLLHDEHGEVDSAEIDVLAKAVVPGLGVKILTDINASAAVGPINLLGLVLQATETQTLDETDLQIQLGLYVDLLKQLPYAPLTTLSEHITTTPTGANIIKYGIDFGLIERYPHELGDVIGLHEENGVMLNYYRNNVKHLLAIPSLIACAYMSQRAISRDKLIEFVHGMYTFARGEYFLRWGLDEVGQPIDAAIAELVRLELLIPEEEGAVLARPKSDTSQIRQLDLLAHIFYETVERYSVILNLLLASPSGTVRYAELEDKCRLAAEKLSILDSRTNPEYLDVKAFRRVMDSVLASSRVWRGDDRNLCYGDDVAKTGALVAKAIDVPVRRISHHH